MAKAPIIPPYHPSAAVVQPPALPPPDLPVAEPARLPPEPGPQVQDPLRLQAPVTPVQARQGSTQVAEPMPPHRTLARPANNRVGQVNKPVANGFTAELNRQEMQSLEAQNTAVRALARAWSLSLTGGRKAMSRPRAADDFVAIRARLEELRRER